MDSQVGAALARARAANQNRGRAVGLEMQKGIPTSDGSVTSGKSDAETQPLLDSDSDDGANTSSRGTESESKQGAGWSLSVSSMLRRGGAHKNKIQVEDVNENKKRLLAYVMLKCFYKDFAYSGAYNREVFTDSIFAKDYIHELFERIIENGELSSFSFQSAKDLAFIWKEAKKLFVEVKTQRVSSRTTAAEEVSRKISTSLFSEDDKESIAAILDAKSASPYSIKFDTYRQGIELQINGRVVISVNTDGKQAVNQV
jgi:hypothetical protein